MGIDKPKASKTKHANTRRLPASKNPYIRVLIKIYRFMARRVTCPFNKVILKRLMMSRNHRPPVSTSKLALALRKKSWSDSIAVVVGDILNDERRVWLPKMRVCALRFSAAARKAIEGAGGECITFDQLPLLAPKGSKVRLLRGKKTGRTACKSYKAPGVPGNHGRPKMGNRENAHMRGRKHERARGRRKSRAWKVKA
mmetsp:Transcript_59956/g.97000  ORF Transcript_59956/g.97000 Transcript_59956/m.97000 type:complete len:198 (+) Transcript_59956:46-639(+)